MHIMGIENAHNDRRKETKAIDIDGNSVLRPGHLGLFCRDGIHCGSRFRETGLENVASAV